MTSVCTGSLVYAAAGVLIGRPATTYWAWLDLLSELDPSIDVRATRFVDDGDMVTSATHEYHQEDHAHGPRPSKAAPRPSVGSPATGA